MKKGPQEKHLFSLKHWKKCVFTSANCAATVLYTITGISYKGHTLDGYLGTSSLLTELSCC